MTGLVADSIAKRFGTRWVLTAASLRADAGAVTALLGRNGAGKTTLLRSTAGWLRPDHGVVRFGGQTFLRPRLHVLARLGLFFLPDRRLLTPGVPVSRQLALVAGRSGSLTDVPGVVDRLGIADVVGHRPESMSGGELRRSEVAMALLRRPTCLVADEPFRGIAPGDIELLSDSFRALARAGGTVVLSGHEIESVFAVADRVVWCTAGTTYHFATTAEARADWRFGREYLGAAP